MRRREDCETPSLSWREQWLPYTTVPLAIFTWNMLSPEKMNLLCFTLLTLLLLCSVRISGHTSPSLAENLFPEQVFVCLWSHLFQHAILTSSGTGMDLSSSRNGVPFSPYSPMYPSSFHPRRWTTPVDAEPSSTFRSRCRLTWCKLGKMLSCLCHTSSGLFPERAFYLQIRDFNKIIFLFKLLCVPESQIFCDVELLRTASLSLCMLLPAMGLYRATDIYMDIALTSAFIPCLTAKSPIPVHSQASSIFWLLQSFLIFLNTMHSPQ